MGRRAFLAHSARLAGVSVAGFAALERLAELAAAGPAPLPATPGSGGYGPLAVAGRELGLPEGFTYRAFSRAGATMSDGRPVPGLHDGTAAFPLPNGNIRLIRNHEVLVNYPGSAHPRAYDASTGGGTTSVEVNARTREVVREFQSLTGTARNCAGGPTPWGSWLSCEETVVGAYAGAGKPHGYVFEVPVLAEEVVEPEPIRAMGRFVHEALAVDPTTGTVYLTEDQARAGLYRFLPDRPYRGPGDPGDIHAGGRLQMLAIRGRDRYDAARRQQVGRQLRVDWVDIREPDPAGAERNPSAVFRQGRERGAARFTRIEGCWYGNGSIYFACTDGGDAGRGQIWRLEPEQDDDGVLTLLFESPGEEVLDSPDNLCVSPKGALLICEDGDARQYVRGLTPDGRIFDFAANIVDGSEFTGVTFSPDGETVFFNLQRPGVTMAVWGPWDHGAL